jgi:hypothetical protein
LRMQVDPAPQILQVALLSKLTTHQVKIPTQILPSHKSILYLLVQWLLAHLSPPHPKLEHP